jgi:predicted DNA-binding transcriptional regulator AlpA
MRKWERQRPYAPDFVSADTLAYRLDCSVRTVEDYVRAKLLPAPVKIGNLVRWCWSDIEQHIARLYDDPLADDAGNGKATADEYSTAIRRFSPHKAKEAADG